MSSPFNWRGLPSIFATDKHFAFGLSVRAHKGEASVVASTSRAPTANINTETTRPADRRQALRKGSIG